ncbi:MAG: hypothetical protein U9P10_05190 [Thermodesulfobacteriota bacterium]|nr:hypothetical protein [Thermodesulfobacteriota bacterium]
MLNKQHITTGERTGDTTAEREKFLKKEKNRYLAALYEKDHPQADEILDRICSHAGTQEYFSENYEKMLNHVRLIHKRFSPEKTAPGTPPADSACNRLSCMVHTSVKKADPQNTFISLENWKKKLGLSKNQEDLLYKTLINFQLTKGCSNFCRRCNEWALPKVRSSFSFTAVTDILTGIAAQGNRDTCLYGASDPLDWRENNTTIRDVISFADGLSLNYNLLTKMPRGSKTILKELVRSRANLSVSVTNKNKKRITALEKEIHTTIPKQHDLDELLIPAGLDEDFTSVKPSITDSYGTEITPDGAYIVIPTFTSALYPFGHDKIPVTSATSFFPVKKSGRDALAVDYFKPMEIYDQNKTKKYRQTLVTAQTATLLLDNGSYDLTPPGMRGIKEYFTVFMEKARLQRKKIAPVAIEKLKKKQTHPCSSKTLTGRNTPQTPNQIPNQTQTRDQSMDQGKNQSMDQSMDQGKNQSMDQSKNQVRIQAYYDMLDPDKCLSAKLYALSFFLEASYTYTKSHPLSLKIIRFLTRNEMEKRIPTHKNADFGNLFERLISDNTIDTFAVFRFLVFNLMTDSPAIPAILDFIRAYPAVYDPSGDWFVKKN